MDQCGSGRSVCPPSSIGVPSIGVISGSSFFCLSSAEILTDILSMYDKEYGQGIYEC